MADLGLHRLPVLGGVAADHAAGHGGRARPGQPRGPRLLLRPGRRAARGRDHARRSRCTTGTCRRPSRTRAAGRTAPPPSGSASTPTIVAAALGDRVGRFDHAQRAVVLGLPRLRQRRARAGPHRRRRRAHGRAPPQPGARPARSPRSARPRPRRRWASRSTWRGCARTTGSAADADAARRVDGLQNRVFLDPILDGRYPADVLADTAAVTDWSFVQPGDLAAIAAPIDVLGVNYYTPTYVRHWTRERPREAPTATATAAPGPGWRATTSSSPASPARSTPRWAGPSTRAG